MSTSREAPRQARSRLVPWLALLLALATFRPPLPAPLGLDVDSSWRLALHRVERWGLSWGDDLAFTYGPLGHLLQPVAEPASASATLALFALVHLLIALSAWELWRRGEIAAGDALTACLLYLVAHGFGLESDGQLQLLLWLLALGALFGRGKSGVAWAAAAGFAAALLPFAKFGFLVSGLGVAALLAAWLARVPSGGARLRALSLGGSAGLLLAWLQFDGSSALGAWLARSWQIAAGFGEAMSTPTRWVDLALAAIVLAALGFVALGEHSAARALALALAPLAVEWKHAFVRSWHRGPLFFAVAAAFAAFLLLVPGSARQRTRARIAAALALVCGLGALAVHDRPWQSMARALSPAASVEALRWTLDPGLRARRLAALEARSEQALRPLRLPDSLRERLASPGTRVAVLPWRLTTCEANGLVCVPPRTLQLYSAYTGALDDWVRAGFKKEPPDFVLLHRPEAQRRQFFASAPATWAWLEAEYEALERFEGQGLLLLAPRPRRPAPKPLQRTLAEHEDDLVVLPPDAAAPILDLPLEPRPLVPILRVFAWLPPIEVELELAGGVVRRRIVPSLAGRGLRLLADDSLATLEAHFRGQPVPVPRTARLLGPGLAFFERGEPRLRRSDSGPTPAVAQGEHP